MDAKGREWLDEPGDFAARPGGADGGRILMARAAVRLAGCLA
jgi:hypothetical protein